MVNKLSNIKSFVIEHQFACFISLCVAIAIVMTGVSLTLYRASGAIKLDMSRPGYEKMRKAVEDSNDDKPFASSGNLDREALRDFDDRVKKLQDDLDKLGDYDSADVSDEDLLLHDKVGEQGDETEVAEQ
ncbi:MAG: hypothetical protein Q4C83_01810 [Candidatus Saccharibacteria bacterium]|nr:hypothetical protein [Candidatus Saccharibacteria bacterium]